MFLVGRGRVERLPGRSGFGSKERAINMDTRRTGQIFGWFFIGTFITSIPARFLFVDGLGATWTDTVFNPAAVSDTSLKLASILEFGVIVTNIATAVVLY